jgi:parallel beta-helix repeat protein
MKRNIGKKATIILLISLFFWAPISQSAVADDSASCTTLFVDDDNVEGPWDGSIEHPYRFIQDGIDQAMTGDIVFVKRGTYLEHLLIQKTIILQGEDTKHTIIDGQNEEEVDGMTLTAHGILVRGFTITNFYGDFNAGIILRSDSNTITCNYLCDNYFGVKLMNAHHNSISKNVINNNTGTGIEITGWTDNSDNNMTDNLLLYNQDGIDLGFSKGDRVIGNIFHSDQTGISLGGYENTIIADNIFTNDGMSLSGYQGSLYIRYNLTVTNNTINGLPLVFLDNETDLVIDIGGQVILKDCTNITITNLTLSHVDTAIHLLNSNNCNITRNSISQCNYGIYLWSRCERNIISNNVISNTIEGICIRERSNHNTIIYNTITRSSIGVYLYYSFSSSVLRNNFYENQGNAYFQFTQDDRWQGNYWGKSRVLPYPIFGDLLLHEYQPFLVIPWISFDWSPAKNPYTIGV